jgi:hypothetical protein
MMMAAASSSATRLAVDLGRNQVFFFRQDAAGINDAQPATAPFGITVKTVAGDAGLVAYDGATRAHDPVEQCGLAYVGASHDGDCGNACGGGGESAGRIVSRLRQNELVERRAFRPPGRFEPPTASHDAKGPKSLL